jgi:hypothetical protein
MAQDNPYKVTNFPSVEITDGMKAAIEHVQKVMGKSLYQVRGEVVCVEWLNDAGPAVFDGLVSDQNGTWAVVHGFEEPVSILIHWSRITGIW